MLLSNIIIETPFDPQYMYIAFKYVGDIFGSSSWVSLIRTFMLIALISGLISAVAFRKYDFIQQFLITLVFTTILAIPVNDTLAFKRSDTERIWTTSNSEAPFLLVEAFKLVNDVTKWFTLKAGANLSNPTYSGMFDAGIGSRANILRNSLEVAFEDPEVRSDLTQFIKECALYDIRDEVYTIRDIKNSSDGFDLILKNTSPARFVTVKSLSGSSDLKTCQDAGIYLNSKMDSEALKNIEEKSKLFFYKNDKNGGNFAETMYKIAVEDSYQDQLNINENVTKIMRQNMFSYMMEVSGSDMARMLKDPSMAESAAIHMGVARSAKKAAFQQSVVAQLGRETLPAMASWFAVILIMLFPFAALMFIVGNMQTSIQAIKGYFLTLFWICLWQPIFAIIDQLGNWELHRQLLKTNAAGGGGVPFGYVHTVYDTLINNHSLVGWMIMLTPVIAGAVAWSSYRGLSGMATGALAQYRGSTSSVGNEMADGNLNMGNTNLGNNNLGNSNYNNTSANKLNTDMAMNTGGSISNDGAGSTYKSNTQSVFRDHEHTVDPYGEYSSNKSSSKDDSIAASATGRGEISNSKNFTSGQTATQGSVYDKAKYEDSSVSVSQNEEVGSTASQRIGHESGTTNTDSSNNTISNSKNRTQQAASHVSAGAGVNAGLGGGVSSGGGRGVGIRDTEGNQGVQGGGQGGGGGGRGRGGVNLGMNGNLNTGVTATAFGNTSVGESDERSLGTTQTDSRSQGSSYEQSARRGTSSSDSDQTGNSQRLTDSSGWRKEVGSQETTSANSSMSSEHAASSRVSSQNSMSRIQNLNNPEQISRAMDQLSVNRDNEAYLNQILADNGFDSREDYERRLSTSPTDALAVQDEVRQFYFSDQSAALGAASGNTSPSVGGSPLSSSANNSIGQYSNEGDRLISTGGDAVNQSIGQNQSKGSSFQQLSFGAGAQAAQNNITGGMQQKRDGVGALSDTRSGRADGILEENKPLQNRGNQTTTEAAYLVNERTGNVFNAIENAPKNIAETGQNIVDAGRGMVDGVIDTAKESQKSGSGWIGSNQNWGDLSGSDEAKKP